MAEVFAIYDMMDELKLTNQEIESVMFDPSEVEFEFESSVMDSQLIY